MGEPLFFFFLFRGRPNKSEPWHKSHDIDSFFIGANKHLLANSVTCPEQFFCLMDQQHFGQRLQLARCLIIYYSKCQINLNQTGHQMKSPLISRAAGGALYSTVPSTSVSWHLLLPIAIIYQDQTLGFLSWKICNLFSSDKIKLMGGPVAKWPLYQGDTYFLHRLSKLVD